MNFTVALTTPVMFENIGYKTYIVFMVFCIVGFLYSVFLLPEVRLYRVGSKVPRITLTRSQLKGLSLEQVDAIFNDTSGAEDRERRERVAKQIGLDKAAADVQHAEKAHGATPDQSKLV